MSFLFPAEVLPSKLPSLLIGSLVWGVMLNMLFSYTVVYYLVPHFFARKKYLIFSLSVIILVAMMAVMAYINTSANAALKHAIGITPQNQLIHLRGTIVRILGNPPLICAGILSFRSIKSWHRRHLENEQLTRENTNAELQLLKAQIHPHFLFNTLNNIYSFALSKSQLASELVQKLSDMLQYMITDCDSPFVPVEKEIQLIKDYIGLEKVRYGDRLNIQMLVNGDCKNCMIAPLLMIPFVENSFKHGASLMRGNKWMHLVIDIHENNLELNISNSKPSQANSHKNKNGIGLLNVQKRLELLYTNKHQINIKSTENTFSVCLKIDLHKQPISIIKEEKSDIPVKAFLKSNVHY